MGSMGSRWQGVTRSLGAAAIAGATACCGPSAFVMGEYNNPGTPAYQCSAPSETTTGTCSTLGQTNEAAWQTSGTVHVPLPKGLFAQCPNGVQRLRIADPGKPKSPIWYECAPPPMPTTIPTAGPPTVSLR